MFEAWIASLFAANGAGYVTVQGKPWFARFRRGRLAYADPQSQAAYDLMNAHFIQTGF